ncbi:hypothetical protein BHM03_00014853 [Ensete ventricosum]|nr:hypothetical protein BHM03_00014853 [Ensete ventricosum]
MTGRGPAMEDSQATSRFIESPNSVVRCGFTSSSWLAEEEEEEDAMRYHVCELADFAQCTAGMHEWSQRQGYLSLTTSNYKMIAQDLYSPEKLHRCAAHENRPTCEPWSPQLGTYALPTSSVALRVTLAGYEALSPTGLIRRVGVSRGFASRSPRLPVWAS